MQRVVLMDRAGIPRSWHDARRRLDDVDAVAARRKTIAASAGRWQWLDAVRGRIDCAVEVLDVDFSYVLDPLPAAGNKIDLRVALGPSVEPELRDLFTAALRSARAEAATIDGIRVRACPLFIRSLTPALAVGVLLIATRVPASGSDETADVDRPLDAVGEWLVPAIEASLVASIETADDTRVGRTAMGMFDLIGALATLDDDERMLTLAMEAISVWYDADVRIYRQDTSGAFVLHTVLPGAAATSMVPAIPGHAIWGRDRVFTMAPSGEIVEDGGMSAPGLTRYVPIGIGDATEWLIAVSGSTVDATAEAPLGTLGRIMGALLTELHRDAVERLERRLATIFAFGDAPFDATAQVVLDAIAAETDATGAEAALYYTPEPKPILTIHTGGPAESPIIDAGSAIVEPDAITVGVAASAGVTMVLGLRRDHGAFGRNASRLARSAAALLGIWMAGILVKPRELRIHQERDTSLSFADRIAAYTDRLGRINVPGAVVVFVPDDAGMSGPMLDETLAILHERLRPTDAMGIIETRGAAVLLPDVTPAIAGNVVSRLLQSARRRGLRSPRAGLATFAAAAETIGSVINRAFMNARRGPAFQV